MPSPDRSESLPLRAARYFGWHDRPRTSIRLNNTSCLIVGEGYEGRAILMHYQETYGKPHGDFIKLTQRALAELMAALETESARV